MKIDQILKITFSGIRNGEEAGVKRLISECGLYTGDISAEKLKHFVIARKGDQVVGAVGLEITGSDALLRSLVVSESYRNQGIATKFDHLAAVRLRGGDEGLKDPVEDGGQFLRPPRAFRGKRLSQGGETGNVDKDRGRVKSPPGPPQLVVWILQRQPRHGGRNIYT